MSFQIHALSPTPFQPLFKLSPEELARRGAIKVTAHSDVGFPCRVSLKEARSGELLILANYQHQAANSPYRSSHAVYVRETATQARLAPGVIPDVLDGRLLSLRGFSSDDMLLTAEVTEGHAAAPGLINMFENTDVNYIHIHNAREGCFHARATRA
ncbi:MAG: DUF1203 domain-containing protein [Boseongicola sp.]|nr:MAG: DUF1203 domain-containing protein [Boseongicola sp.]